METITDRIRARFEAERGGRTRRKFALDNRLDPQAFDAYLKGREPKEHLQAVADALRVPWQWLLIGDDGFDAIKAWKAPGGSTGTPTPRKPTRPPRSAPRRGGSAATAVGLTTRRPMTRAHGRRADVIELDTFRSRNERE